MILLKRCNWFLVCLFYTQLLFAQNTDCKKITSFLEQRESQVNLLNLFDPDFIPLHFLLSKDIIKELEQFRNEVIPFFSSCPELSFDDLINNYDNLFAKAHRKCDSLYSLNANIHIIYYTKALFEYQYGYEDAGDYYLQRSLQYNETFPNAILLKLKILLHKGLYQSCLSLLNTLYYDTEMDREQEIRAIEFTDNYYHKLYYTGDSLVKEGRAAEALELFEILETFCLNLPSSYCNDDYFHGILRSKSGIYDSYLAIAKVAETRGNLGIASHFYQYAQEYLESNTYLQNSVRKLADASIETVLATNDTVFPSPDVVIIPPEPERQDPKFSREEMQQKYDQLVLQALVLCIKEEFSASYKLFSTAKELEDCGCLETDFRVDTMLNELSRFGIK